MRQQGATEIDAPLPRRSRCPDTILSLNNLAGVCCIPRYFSPIGPLPLAVQMLPQGVQLACWTGVGQAFGRVLNSRTRTDLEISRNDNLHPPMWISVRSPSWPERSFGSV